MDLTLLIELGLPGREAVKRPIEATFADWNTHPVPTTLEPPPADWREPFAALAAECALDVASLEAASAKLSEYWQTLALR